MSTDPISAADEVRAILADPGYVVPPAAAVPETEYGTLAWLRSLVARFCDGDVHERRRALVERDLAGFPPDRLRLAAAELTRSELAQQARGEQFDAMILARRVPVAVLASELGLAGYDLRRAVDAVITDVAFKDGPDGWQVARRARARTEDLPVVYMTGGRGDEWAPQHVPMGVLLLKPFPVSQLVEMVGQMIAASREGTKRFA